MTKPSLIKVYAAAAATFALAYTAAAVQPDYLLTIDDSNPAAITVTATGNAPLVSTIGNIANDGVDLLGFFAQDQANMTAAQNLPNSTLTGGNLAIAYNDVWSDAVSTPGSFFDLSLYVDNSSPDQGDPEEFSTGTPAFTGSWTFDLTGQNLTSGALPAPGAMGNIIAGDSNDPGAQIGQWQVVATPEPSTMGLFTMGAMVLTAAMFRKNSSAK